LTGTGHAGSTFLVGPRIAVAVAAVCLAGGARAHDRVDHPLRDVRLVCRSGGDGRFVLRARWSPAPLPHPEVRGAVLTIAGTAADREHVLPASGWRHRRRGPRYRSARRAPGIRTVALRRGRRGFRLVVRGTGDDPCHPIADLVEMVLAVADDRWCLAVPRGAVEPTRRGARARVAEAPATCPCDVPAETGTWEALQDRVFARHVCAQLGCHGGAPAPAGLVLAGDAAWDLVVGVPSVIAPAVLRVEPGAPERSMLWLKIAARTLGWPDVPGPPMPIGEPVPDALELEALAHWILAGAPRTGHVPAADALLRGCPDGASVSPSTPR
jgi:hypothetical protein